MKIHKNSTKSTETSIIAKDTTIKGDLEFVGNLVVEGKLESQIKGAELTVQECGEINGTLTVRSLNCHGKIDGDIHADQVTIYSTSVITGAINAASLEVAPGATINGNINMKGKNQTADIQSLSDQVLKKNILKG